MRWYADTSWWLAYKCSDDSSHRQAVALLDRHDDTRVLWTPWQRVEVLNGLRQLERNGAVQPGKAREFIRVLEQEVRLGYWPHVEFDWRDAVRTACEMSADFGLRVAIRGMDLFHVAIAIEVGADAFVTFDRDQRDVAKIAGLPVLPLRARVN
jgi:predicted nucleic acid-binding protein